jgi:imidazolonepropionase-like amidohydrolase
MAHFERAGTFALRRRNMGKRRLSTFAVLAASLMLCGQGFAQTPTQFSKLTRKFITVDSPVVALEHVTVIDGTGAAARADQTVILSSGKIQSIGPAASTAAPAGSKVLDLTGYTVIPGLVGMHDHFFYPDGASGYPRIYSELGFSAPRLYLAGGVTTLRTTGSIEPYTDIELKKLIDSGEMPGPDMIITGPYLEGVGAFTPQMHQLTGPDDARRMVNYWADEGATTFKAYMNITRAELSAAIAAAHKRHLTITGHLCSIGFREAAKLGIDNLEHGLMVDTEFDPGKQPDVCPPGKLTTKTLLALDVNGPEVKKTIATLVAHHVAVTSTLPVFETFATNRPPIEQRVLDAMTSTARISYLTRRAEIADMPNDPYDKLFPKEEQFEHEFAEAGGLLLGGPDPTGYGGVVPGFGDQREVELLVEAGFTPVQAIHIATENGAKFLRMDDRIGTLAAGKDADLVVIHGDPAKDIKDIEKVETVFKNGIGYDSAKLIEASRGSVGLH